LRELSDSIKEMGVIQPLIVRSINSGHEIVAGERRWRAARLAGYSTIPVIVKTLSDSESLEIALIENIQREDLNALDTAEAYDLLIKKFSYTHEVLAKRIGKDRTSITNHLRLLKLPEPIKTDLRAEKLSMGHAKTLLSVEHLPLQLSLSKQVVRRELSVRDLEKIVQNYKNKQVKAESRPIVKDPDIEMLEKNLSTHLSTRVSLKRKSDKSGKIEIFFHSQEELDRLIDVLGYSEDLS
jgi:ParB family transcriptional regulator, chromosome partitioning protein